MEQATQPDIFGQRFVYLFAAAWSAFAMLYITIITFFPIPETSIRFADTVLGFVLGTVISNILAYFYGSSKSSKDKDAAITSLAANAAK